jgi:peptidoglycan/LPS O-acetylase OafA/YrhL
VTEHQTYAPVKAATRRPDIQGLRAIAVLLVVAYHSGLPVPGGFVGVDVFFVISGFVITAMLHREWLSTGQLRLGTFYLRRFRRLTPALALTVSVTVVLSTFLMSPLGAQQVTAQTGLGAMLLSANLVIAKNTGGYFDGAAEGNPLLNTWSLSVEEQFYLGFPLLILGGWVIARRFGRARYMPVLLVASIGLVSFALALFISTGHALPRVPDAVVGFYSPLTRAWEFATGGVLALLPRVLLPTTRRLAATLAASGFLLLVASAFLISGDTPFPGAWTLLPVLGTILLIRAGSQPANSISRGLALRPIVSLGDVSYSWYLWHWPLIVFATLVWPGSSLAPLIAAILSLLPSVASYRWVEQPIRSASGIGTMPFTRIATVTMGVPLVLASSLLVSVNHGFWIPQVQALQVAVLPIHSAGVADCGGGTPMSERASGDCWWNLEANGAPVYLLGDSTAGHLSEAVVGAGIELDRPIAISTYGDCPPLRLSISTTSPPGAETPDHWKSTCRNLAEGNLAWVNRQDPGLVILASTDYIWRDPDWSIGITPETETNDPQAKTDLLTSALATTITELENSGHKVMVVQALPNFFEITVPPWDPQHCSTFDITRGDCSAVQTESEMDQLQAGTRRATQLAADATDASVVDLRAKVCRDGICATELAGDFLYQDVIHISVATSQALVPDLVKAIRDTR